MAIPTLVATKTYSSSNDRTNVDVPLPQSADGVINGDVLVAASGHDLTAVGSPPAAPAYASAGWISQVASTWSSTGQSQIFYCKITDATAIPATDVFAMGGNRESVWSVMAVRGVDTTLIESWSSANNSKPSWAEGSVSTTNNDNFIISVTGSDGGQGDLAISTPGSWTLSYKGYVNWTVDAWAAIGYITQATAGAISKQDLNATSTSDANCTIALPGTSTTVTELSTLIVSASTVTVAEEQIHTPTVNVTPVSTVTVTEEQIHDPTVNIASASTVTVELDVVHEPTVNVTSASTVTVDEEQIHTPTVDAASTSTVTVNVSNVASGIIELSADVTSASTLTTSLSVVAEIGTTISAASSMTVNLSNTAAGVSELSVTATSASTMTVDLVVVAEIGAVSASASTVTVNLSNEALLSTVIAATSTMTVAVYQIHDPTIETSSTSTMTAALTTTALVTRGFIAHATVTTGHILTADTIAV